MVMRLTPEARCFKPVVIMSLLLLCAFAFPMRSHSVQASVPAATPSPIKRVLLQNAQSEKCLTFTRLAKGGGTVINQRACDPGRSDQLWQWGGTADPYRSTVRNVALNLCLVDGYHDDEGYRKLALGSCYSNNVWYITDPFGPQTSLQHENTGLCLSLYWFDTTEGAEIRMAPCNQASPSQTWFALQP